MNNIPDLIRDILQAREPKEIEADRTNYIHAAVLIPLFNDNGRYAILFTERTRKVEHHKGQISFPGGKVEDGDPSYLEYIPRDLYF